MPISSPRSGRKVRPRSHMYACNQACWTITFGGNLYLVLVNPRAAMKRTCASDPADAVNPSLWWGPGLRDLSGRPSPRQSAATGHDLWPASEDWRPVEPCQQVAAKRNSGASWLYAVDQNMGSRIQLNYRSLGQRLGRIWRGAVATGCCSTWSANPWSGRRLSCRSLIITTSQMNLGHADSGRANRSQVIVCAVAIGARDVIVLDASWSTDGVNTTYIANYLSASNTQ